MFISLIYKTVCIPPFIDWRRLVFLFVLDGKAVSISSASKSQVNPRVLCPKRDIIRDRNVIWSIKFKYNPVLFNFTTVLAKFPHSPILHCACRSLLTENNGKKNASAVGLCAVFVVSWWRNKGLRTLNRMHNEVWGCAEI